MTDTEIEIIKTEYEHHEKLMSEIASSKSFAGGMASIAAFLVLEWLTAEDPPNAFMVVVAVVPLCLSAVLFFKLCFGETYKFPSEAENWMDWRKNREIQLVQGQWSDTSEIDLRHAYYRKLQTALAINRPLIIQKQKYSEVAGLFSMSPVLVVLGHAVFRFITSS